MDNSLGIRVLFCLIILITLHADASPLSLASALHGSDLMSSLKNPSKFATDPKVSTADSIDKGLPPIFPTSNAIPGPETPQVAAPGLFSLNALKILPKYPSDNNVMKIIFGRTELSNALKQTGDALGINLEEQKVASDVFDPEENDNESVANSILTEPVDQIITGDVDMMTALTDIDPSSDPSAIDLTTVPSDIAEMSKIAESESVSIYGSAEIASVSEVTPGVHENPATDSNSAQLEEKMQIAIGAKQQEIVLIGEAAGKSDDEADTLTTTKALGSANLATESSPIVAMDGEKSDDQNDKETETATEFVVEDITLKTEIDVKQADIKKVDVKDVEVSTMNLKTETEASVVDSTLTLKSEADATEIDNTANLGSAKESVTHLVSEIDVKEVESMTPKSEPKETETLTNESGDQLGSVRSDTLDRSKDLEPDTSNDSEANIVPPSPVDTTLTSSDPETQTSSTSAPPLQTSPTTSSPLETSTLLSSTPASSEPQTSTTASAQPKPSLPGRVLLTSPRQICSSAKVPLPAPSILKATTGLTKLILKPDLRSNCREKFAVQRPLLFQRLLPQKRFFKRAVGNEKQSSEPFVTPSPVQSIIKLEEIPSETSLERAERINTALGKMMNFVQVASQVDNFLMSRVRSGIRKFGQLFEVDDYDTGRRKQQSF